MERITYDAAPPPKQGFWRRQFAAEPSPEQDRFDLWFGVALPVACFALDPVSFKGWLLDRGFLEEYRLFAYMVSALQIGMLLCWFTFRRDLETFAAPFAGIFVAGAVFSMVIGIAILPVTLVGLMFVVGLAGFMPFLTAFVYLRTGVRAMKAQLNNATFAHRYLVAVLTAFLVIALPFFGSMYLQPLMPQSQPVERPWDETWDGD